MSRPLALLSVSDKTGVVELGRGLSVAGFEILSTGGTARALRAGGVEVTAVEEFTGQAEMMDGRVKTLHPRVHGGILGLREAHTEEAAAHGIRWIDLVAVNLYPFEATISSGDPSLEEAVEQIDIGGPTMVRSAAKNHAHVTILTDPADYGAALEALGQGGPDLAMRRALAVKAFRHTAAYDAVISAWLSERTERDELGRAPFPGEGAIPLRRVQGLRYGENPHQRASFYAEPGRGGRSLARAIQLQGKELSFNNLADLDATLRAAFDLEGPGCVIVKHMNPCGAAVHEGGMAPAFELALSGDPVSAYGGIVVFNRAVDEEAVRTLRRSRVFFEVIAAPGFSPEGRALLAARENLRVLELPADWAARRPEGFDARRVQGGWLLQDWDVGQAPAWEQSSAAAPSPEEDGALRFAWAICRNVKSNAIVLARPCEGGFVLNGTGAGQMSRVDSVRLAVSKATRAVPGSVLASDAFFPFADGVEVALEAGVRAFVQPGGSIRDAEVLAAVDGAGASMVFTGVRHFRH